MSNPSEARARRLRACALGISTLVACGIPEAGAQTKGRLAYDTATDAGFLTLWGTNGNRLARLWVGEDDTKGRLLIYEDGDDKVLIDSDINSQGRIVLYGSSDETAARLTVDDTADSGLLYLYDDTGTVRVDLGVDPFGQGRLILDGSDNVDRGRFGVDDDTDSAFLHLRGQSQATIGEVGRYSAGQANHGRLLLYADGSTKVDLHADPVTDGGRILLRDSSGAVTIVLNGETGDVTGAGMKSFVVAHPADPSKEIFYVALEGPEAGIFTRGTASLNQGEATVALPEHFAALADPATITVQLTPGSAESSGLAVVSKSAREIEVRELQGGTGDFTFDYLVHASRADVAPLQVVRARASRELIEDAPDDAPAEEQDSPVRQRGDEGDSQSEGGVEQGGVEQ